MIIHVAFKVKAIDVFVAKFALDFGCGCFR